MRFFLNFFLLFSFTQAFSQESVIDATKIAVDSLYREDQFYFNFTYNSLAKTPHGLRQNKFSPGIAIGFLRDMPLNKKRTLALALGLGYSSSSYNHNLYQYKNQDGNGNEARVYEVLSSDIFYDKSKQVLHYVDVPFEIRWRNSTCESHKFWRIYTGFKVSYLFADKYKFVNDVQTIIIKNNPDLNKLQYGCYITAGWNTWNFYAYYGLNPIFKSAKIVNDDLNMNTLNIGLQFYIL